MLKSLESVSWSSGWARAAWPPARLCLASGRARRRERRESPMTSCSDAARVALATLGARARRSGGTRAGRIERADLVVVSPGVPPLPEVIEAARRAAFLSSARSSSRSRCSRHPAPVVAIGGTNGKSTTTSLVGALLEAHGLAHVRRRATSASRSRITPDERFDVVVLEVSSFQMERVHAFHPRVGAPPQRHRRPPRSLCRASTSTRTPRATRSLVRRPRRLGGHPRRRRRLRAAGARGRAGGS